MLVTLKDINGSIGVISRGSKSRTEDSVENDHFPLLKPKLLEAQPIIYNILKFGPPNTKMALEVKNAQK